MARSIPKFFLKSAELEGAANDRGKIYAQHRVLITFNLVRVYSIYV